MRQYGIPESKLGQVEAELRTTDVTVELGVYVAVAAALLEIVAGILDLLWTSGHEGPEEPRTEGKTGDARTPERDRNDG